MNKYIVNISETWVRKIEVDAKDEYEAKSIACHNLKEGELVCVKESAFKDWTVDKVDKEDD